MARPNAAPLSQLRAHSQELWREVFETIPPGEEGPHIAHQALAAALMGDVDLAKFILSSPGEVWLLDWPKLPRTDVVTLTLTTEQCEALHSTFDSAERGRDDFDHLASQDKGDYEPEDIENAKAWHAKEKAVEAFITEKIKEQTK